MGKREAAPLPKWKRPCRCARFGAASKFWTFTMSKSAAPRAP
jgi:hypothetical protein